MFVQRRFRFQAVAGVERLPRYLEEYGDTGNIVQAYGLTAGVVANKSGATGWGLVGRDSRSAPSNAFAPNGETQATNDHPGMEGY